VLAEEYGLPKAVRSPLKAAAGTFVFFVLCGAVPLVPFLVESLATFQVSIVMTALVFFLIGSSRSRWSPVSRRRSGPETMAVALGAAALAFLIGHGLKSLVR
jgi:VIT1/CCC1 family predicted Fe2+/Mn2+ transporter